MEKKMENDMEMQSLVTSGVHTYTAIRELGAIILSVPFLKHPNWMMVTYLDPGGGMGGLGAQGCQCGLGFISLTTQKFVKRCLLGYIYIYISIQRFWAIMSPTFGVQVGVELEF